MILILKESIRREKTFFIFRLIYSRATGIYLLSSGIGVGAFVIVTMGLFGSG